MDELVQQLKEYIQQLKEYIQEKCGFNNKFMIAKYCASDVYLFINGKNKLTKVVNFGELRDHLKDAIGDTGVLYIEDRSDPTVNWSEFNCYWTPHPQKKLYYDVFSDNVSNTYEMDDLINHFTEESLSVNELINKINKCNKSLQDKQNISTYNKNQPFIPTDETSEPLFLYSKLLYFVSTEPKFDVSDLNKKHVKIYYK